MVTHSRVKRAEKLKYTDFYHRIFFFYLFTINDCDLQIDPHNGFCFRFNRYVN